MIFKKYLIFSLILKFFYFSNSFEIFVGNNGTNVNQTGTMTSPYYNLTYALVANLQFYNDLEISLVQNIDEHIFSGEYIIKNSKISIR